MALTLQSSLLLVPQSERNNFFKRSIPPDLPPSGFPSATPESFRNALLLIGGDMAFQLPVKNPELVNFSTPLLSVDELFNLTSILTPQMPAAFLIEVPHSSRRTYISAAGEQLVFDPYHPPSYSDQLLFCWRELKHLSNPAHDQAYLEKWLRIVASTLNDIPIGYFSRHASDHAAAQCSFTRGTDLGIVTTYRDIPASIAKFKSEMRL